MALPILDFTRVVHSFGDDCKAGFDWLRKFADDLMLCNMESDDEFTKGLLEEARDYFVKRSNAGKLGGRPSSNGKPASKAAVPLPTLEDFKDWADDEGLDSADAREWWEMTVVDRDGKDRYGKPIGNWKAACKRFCTAKSNKRR